MKIAVAKSRLDKKLVNKDIPWDELLVFLNQTKRTLETVEEYRKMKAAKKEASEFLQEEEKANSNYQEGMEKAIQHIRESERKAGEESINNLYAKLLAEKRFEDLERATKDEEYRKKLLEE